MILFQIFVFCCRLSRAHNAQQTTGEVKFAGIATLPQKSLKLCGKLRFISAYSSFSFSESNFILFFSQALWKIICYVLLFLKIIMWNLQTVFDVINNLGDRKDKKNHCFIFELVFNSFIYLFGQSYFRWILNLQYVAYVAEGIQWTLPFRAACSAFSFPLIFWGILVRTSAGWRTTTRPPTRCRRSPPPRRRRARCWSWTRKKVQRLTTTNVLIVIIFQ